MSKLTVHALLLTATVLFATCKKRTSDCPVTAQYQQVSPSAKTWFPYSGNTTLTFESSSSSTATLELKNYFFGDDDVWVGDECPITKGQFLRGDIIDPVSNDTIATEIGFGDEVQIKKKGGYILYYDNRAVLILASAYRRFENSIILNGKTFNSVLVFECSPTDRCTPTGITKFYFSKARGLIAFERNSTLFTIRG